MSSEPVLDADNPEWTEADFRKARPASEVLGKRLARVLRSPTKPEAVREADLIAHEQAVAGLTRKRA